MSVLSVVGLMVVAAAGGLPAWEFESEGDAEAWPANHYLEDVAVHDGVYSARAVDWDPFFTCRIVDIEAEAWQLVRFRIRADKPGWCDLFWSGKLDGEYGGLSESKKCRFALKGTGEWEEVAVFPFWQAEGRIRQLRFDVYNGAQFDMDWIRIEEWGDGEPLAAGPYDWDFDKDSDAWPLIAGAPGRFGPRLSADTAGLDWVTVELTSGVGGSGSVLWGCGVDNGLHSESFEIVGDGRPHVYNIEMQGIPSWRSPLVAVGIQVPDDDSVRIHRISMGAAPSGAPDVALGYVGFADAPNRAGKACRVMARVSNRGGTRADGLKVKLVPGAGVVIVEGGASQAVSGLGFGEHRDVVWTVRRDEAGPSTMSVSVTGSGSEEVREAAVTFDQAIDVEASSYVPAPRPVDTERTVCAYYFPGWNAYGKWECIRTVAPVRKPMLGYYDESSPECVDWQIKWARENGISCFLVDWYWVAGGESLKHWFEAYRVARYRDQLQVAIMWANHNPAGTHSREDWEAVTREWIDNYFNLPGYLRIDGKPAVFIWDPHNIRRDLGGSEAGAEAYGYSQQAAKAAGYEGVSFVAMGHDFSRTHCEALEKEGYAGVTSYHEWAHSTDIAGMSRRRRYSDVAATVVEAWAEREAASGALTYLPVVDTGWDSRPWHGTRAMAIQGRTVNLFGKILKDARTFCQQHDRDIVVLGPLNEWGEGSYIEPNTEFGFRMYEQVREVFGKGGDFPVNIAPTDVGLGPYDYPEPVSKTSWTFESGTEGWTGSMGVKGLKGADGALQFTTSTDDPALVVSMGQVKAAEWSALEIEMSLEASELEHGAGQVFWSGGGHSMSEAASVRFPLDYDGIRRTYRVELSENPRWRGNVGVIRFDPCSARGVRVTIRGVRFVK